MPHASDPNKTWGILRRPQKGPVERGHVKGATIFKKWQDIFRQFSRKCRANNVKKTSKSAKHNCRHLSTVCARDQFPGRLLGAPTWDACERMRPRLQDREPARALSTGGQTDPEENQNIPLSQQSTDRWQSEIRPTRRKCSREYPRMLPVSVLILYNGSHVSSHMSVHKIIFGTVHLLCPPPLLDRRGVTVQGSRITITHWLTCRENDKFSLSWGSHPFTCMLCTLHWLAIRVMSVGTL